MAQGYSKAGERAASIGRMSERVTLQEPNKQPNGQGGFKIDKANPVIIGEYWAAVRIHSNQLALMYGGKHAEANIEFTVRVNNRLHGGCQVVWKSQTFDIVEIIPGKQPGYIRIFAKEVI